MRGKAVAAAVLGAVLALPAGASAAPPPEGAAISPNLEYLTRSPEARGITEGKFDKVNGKEVLVITGRFGFKTYDVSEPAEPKLLDEFIPKDIEVGGYWQNEDMELDTKRKLIIGALDPRHTDRPLGLCRAGGSTADPNCKSGFYVISYANPKDMKQIGDFVELPSGHTSSCIQNCKYIWTGGPARRSDQLWLGPILSPSEAPTSRYFNTRLIGDGRPIWVTDLTNPYEPQVSDMPVDIWRNDGYTDYSHDVDEDDEGIAWVSGRGGIRGYATKGQHRDPYTNQWRKATPLEPVLVAGGGVAGTAQPVMLMHNSGRPVDGSVRASGVKQGNILIGTEEEFTRPCEQSGKIVLSDLSDSWGGEPAANSSLAKPYRMKALDTFHPFIDSAETSDPALGCSAHYFEIEGPLLGAGWYGQGLRLVDISNARNVRQVGYYRITSATTGESSNTWDVAFRSDRKRGDLVYVFDANRGVEVLRIKGGGAYASKSMKKVTAPSVKSAVGAPQPVASLVDDGGTGFICPLFQY
jgi:hypothetical protein